MNISHNQISDFIKLTEKATSLVFIPHKSPDGDAIGSILGWKQVLENRGVEVNVVVPDDVPSNLLWMAGASEVIIYENKPDVAKEILNKADVFFLLDFNNLDRCGKIAETISKLNTPRILIDHHPFPAPDIADVVFSDTSVSSTCELSYHILSELGWGKYIDKEAAECIYSGIMTDTGLLSYNSSDPRTYMSVADLVKRGIDKDKIHKELFQSNSYNRMKLLGHVLCNKLEVLEESKTAFFAISKDDLEQYKYKPGDTEGFVNYPLSIKGIEVSALFTEREKDNLVKVSLRSRDDIPVNKYSEQFFSGGGHTNAAGGQWEGELSEAVDRFRETFPLFMNKYLAEKKQK